MLGLGSSLGESVQIGVVSAFKQYTVYWESFTSSLRDSDFNAIIEINRGYLQGSREASTADFWKATSQEMSLDKFFQ